MGSYLLHALKGDPLIALEFSASRNVTLRPFEQTGICRFRNLRRRTRRKKKEKKKGWVGWGWGERKRDNVYCALFPPTTSTPPPFPLTAFRPTINFGCATSDARGFGLGGGRRGRTLSVSYTHKR